MNDQIMGDQDVLSSAKDIIEVVPTAYDDVLRPAARETGKLIALVPQTINAALSPLRQWIAQREYNVNETSKLLAQKLENVNCEKIVSPDAYVAVPAMQAISYSMNSDELRDLYANLLAKSMYKDTKNYVHPSFVEIIKQLSPLDARVFNIIASRPWNPVLDLKMKNKVGIDYRLLYTNVTDIEIATQDLVAISIDNLIKQNLIKIPSDGFYTLEEVYQSVVQTDFYREQENLHKETEDGYIFAHTKKMIETTNLGRMFYSICMTDIDIAK